MLDTFICREGGVKVGVLSGKESEPMEVNGKPLRCVVCQHGTFHIRSAQLHDQWKTLFDVEWASPACTCLIRAGCGYVHWFLPT